MEFLPSLPVLAAFTAAAIVIILSPGPDMTLFLARTLGQGRGAGFASYLGATAGLLVHTVFAAFGLSALLAASADAFTAVKIAGALYLFWLAVDAIRNGSALTLEKTGEKQQNFRAVFMRGFWINLLNPKIILFFVTFLPQFVTAGDPDAAARLIFFGLYFIALAFPVCSLLILMADRIAAWVRRSAWATRVLDWVFAGVLATFAVRLLLEPNRS